MGERGKIMQYKLAQGTIKEGNKLNLLVIRNGDQVEKTISYNLSYEIEKILRTNHLNQDVSLSLLVEEL
jgi:hypothetical protein